MIVLADYPGGACEFELNVLSEQNFPVLFQVGLAMFKLAREVRRYVVLRPNLSVGVRVTATHQLSFVLEDLHGAVWEALAEFTRLLGPRFDNRCHLLDAQC